MNIPGRNWGRYLPEASAQTSDWIPPNYGGYCGLAAAADGFTALLKFKCECEPEVDRRQLVLMALKYGIYTPSGTSHSWVDKLIAHCGLPVRWKEPVGHQLEAYWSGARILAPTYSPVSLLNGDRHAAITYRHMLCKALDETLVLGVVRPQVHWMTIPDNEVYKFDPNQPYMAAANLDQMLRHGRHSVVIYGYQMEGGKLENLVLFIQDNMLGAHARRMICPDVLEEYHHLHFNEKEAKIRDTFPEPTVEDLQFIRASHQPPTSMFGPAHLVSPSAMSASPERRGLTGLVYKWPEKKKSVLSKVKGGMKNMVISMAYMTKHYVILSSNEQHLCGAYSGFRPVLRVGECFYRSFIFSYLEQVLGRQDTLEEHHLLAAIKEVGRQRGRIAWASEFSKSRKAFKKLIKKVMRWKRLGRWTRHGRWMRVPTSNRYRREKLVEFFSGYNKTEHIFAFLRMATAIWICSHWEDYVPRIPDLRGNYTLIDWCFHEVIMERSYADHVQMTALATALGVPLRVENLLQGVGQDLYTSQDPEDNVKMNAPLPPVQVVNAAASSTLAFLTMKVVARGQAQYKVKEPVQVVKVLARDN